MRKLGIAIAGIGIVLWVAGIRLQLSHFTLTDKQIILAGQIIFALGLTVMVLPRDSRKKK
ncbi:hypothetical protein [Paenibacillus sp. NFR01]|uniref:hypothetical protein n=1 Tax=Paenibacillus sp. NFR01 TaxID=1566279 RepID=UPI0008B25F0B|nr:hypothetical protein [Paenibacillus sp. NFR01]SEU29994.1 hypothetical protein SAMN03159358_4860 [Paenibacillus sp. NFR01]